MASPWEQAKAGQKISAPKQSKYHGYQGQSGGMSSVPSSSRVQSYKNLDPYGAAATREKFFGDRYIPSERLGRRGTQARIVDEFKQSLIDQGRFMKDSRGNPVFTDSGDYVYLNDLNTGKSLGDVMQEAAFKYGPTPKEVFGDIGYGISNIFKDVNPLSLIPGVGTAMKIGEGLQSLYNYFTKKPTVTYGGDSNITVREEPVQIAPQFPYNFETTLKPKPDSLQPSEMSQEQFMESYPELYSENPLFKQQTYQPIKVQDVDPSRLLVQNFNIPTVEDVVEQLSDYYNAYEKGVNLKTPVGDINLNPARQEIFLGNSLPIGEDRSVFYTGSMNPNDMSYDVGIGTQLPYGVDFKLGASSNDVPGIGFSKRLGPINAGLGFSEEGSNLNLNTFVDPIRALYPTSSIGLPLNIGATVSDTGKIIPNISLMKQFKKGGSVEKHAGLGYMLK